MLNKAIEIVSKDTVGFGMSIDMDGFREEDAPAVGTPEAGGVIADDFLKAVGKANLDKLLGNFPLFVPPLNHEGKRGKQ